jgi:hypothetical protein
MASTGHARSWLAQAKTATPDAAILAATVEKGEDDVERKNH